jgi:hypothetical protein
MNKYEKILHWLILLAFLGLCATALATEYFFSKEAILDSFKKSLPMINATIAPVDQFFVSRIVRRDTWMCTYTKNKSTCKKYSFKH